MVKSAFEMSVGLRNYPRYAVAFERECRFEIAGAGRPNMVRGNHVEQGET